MKANSEKYQNLRKEKHATSVVCDAYDRKAYDKLKGQAQKLQELEESGSRELPTFSPLMQDVYSSLYKFAPELRKNGEILPSHRFHRSMIEQLMKTSEFKELRTYTKLDEFNSAMATLSLAGQTLALVPKEIQDKAKEINNLEDQIESLEDQIEGLGNLLSQANGQIAKAKASGQGTKSLEVKVSDLETQALEAEMSLEEAKQKLETLEQALEEEVESKTPEIRGAIRQATKEALEEVKETSEFLEQWGNDAGSVQNMPVEEKIRRASVLQNSDKMRQLARLVGKFKRLAMSTQRTKIKKASTEVYDVVRGSDLDRVLPTEFDNLAHPLMKLDFYKRYVEGNLLIYEKKGKEKVGKGPIIVCCDNSGSMEGPKEFWSKAVALALLEIAKLQKRNFACIHFGAEKTPTKCIEVPNGKVSFEKAVEIGSYFLNDSGTGFMRPLNEATSLIEKQEFKKADIVFITDGECPVSDEFLRNFKETKKVKAFKVISILVDMGSTTPTTVAEFSDDVQFVSELSGAEAGEIFACI
ncbi:MAG: hypothetical protein WCT50_04575 [Patescibacteria group bacterium]|jgi:uncharacterized protein with von Willebrand factor type A (vWA) domain